MIRLFAAVIAVLALAADTATVSGTWQVGLQGDHVIPVALVLKQDGRKVTGKILLPRSQGERAEIELVSEFADETLTLASPTEERMQIRGGERQTTVNLSGT